MNSRSTWQSRRAAMEMSGRRSTILGPKPLPALNGALAVGKVVSRWSGLSWLARHTVVNVAFGEIAIECPGLPSALDGFTILHLSDPHLESSPHLAAHVAPILSDLSVDAAVITGDFQIGSHRSSDPHRAASLLRPLVDAMRTRHGIFGVLGNHDSWHVVDPLERIGIRMLINEHVTVGQGDAAFQLAGIDDVHAFYTEHAEHALRAVPTGFRILLAHTPEMAGHAAEHGYDLYLCGHTHGGQICLPGGRPILTALDRHRDLASGHWRIGVMNGYTNRGLGIGGMPIRLNCPAEIALLRLRSVPD